ncbi:hypothetical protein R1flu_011778 [Riccia fluitans]|uniref:Uncharacterized protein n=1 Tax=Riccia fluitans TaxID=41844 RepID=A0ABD1Z944_9MARC
MTPPRVGNRAGAAGNGIVGTAVGNELRATGNGLAGNPSTNPVGGTPRDPVVGIPTPRYTSRQGLCPG